MFPIESRRPVMSRARLAAAYLVIALALTGPGCDTLKAKQYDLETRLSFTALFVCVSTVVALFSGLIAYLVLIEIIEPDASKFARLARACWIVCYVGCVVCFLLSVYVNPLFFSAPLFPALIGALASSRAKNLAKPS